MLSAKISQSKSVKHSSLLRVLKSKLVCSSLLYNPACYILVDQDITVSIAKNILTY
jgi:hypothetical protein